MNNKNHNIFIAAAVGDFEYIENSISKGMDMNNVSETGWTLLM
ncbi:hypothetical protein [Paenibacillus sp. SI8]